MATAAAESQHESQPQLGAALQPQLGAVAEQVDSQPQLFSQPQLDSQQHDLWQHLCNQPNRWHLWPQELQQLSQPESQPQVGALQPQLGAAEQVDSQPHDDSQQPQSPPMMMERLGIGGAQHQEGAGQQGRRQHNMTFHGRTPKAKLKGIGT